MSSTPQSSKKITDHKVIIFDVYGTLADWESGLFNAFKSLLDRYPTSKAWSRNDALSAFMSVEGDLQSQYPDMLYSELLAKVHESLEERLKVLSGEKPNETAPAASAAATDPSAAATADAGASTSAAAAESAKEDEHTTFGNSIQHWPIFPDTCEALRRLAKHFKLVVLSNVDRSSFRYTHKLLAEGPSSDTDLQTYTYPESNPNKYWHPQATPGSKSPFTLIMTAQDTGCYKPALGGFNAALEYFAEHPELFGDLGLGSGEEVKDKVLSVAQSLPHDHEPASQLGMRSVWIDRQSAVTCNVTPGGPDAKRKWTWRFETLGEMADAVEREIGA